MWRSGGRKTAAPSAATTKKCRAVLNLQHRTCSFRALSASRVPRMSAAHIRSREDLQQYRNRCGHGHPHACRLGGPSNAISCSLELLPSSRMYVASSHINLASFIVTATLAPEIVLHWCSHHAVADSRFSLSFALCFSAHISTMQKTGAQESKVLLVGGAGYIRQLRYK